MKPKLLTIAWLCFVASSLYGQEVIFEDDFETGTFGAQWTARPNIDGGQNGIAEIFTNSDGSSYVRLGKSSDAGGFTTNALDLSLDLTGQTDVELLFAINNYSDETQDADGLYMSDDGGSTFTKVFDFKPGFWCADAWGSFPPLSVSKLATDHGLTLNSQFVIRFQQYDNHDFSWSGSGRDGFSLDNVVVRTSPAVHAKLPVDDDFDDRDIPDHWQVALPDQTTDDPNSITPIRVQGIDSDANRTDYYLEMGGTCDGEFYTNAYDLLLDLAGEIEVEMWFDIYGFSDENHPNDGLFFSDDGGDTFVKVFSFNPEQWCDEWGSYAPFDVDKLARENGLTLSSQFVIRFQQYDNHDFSWSGSGRDGMRLDNVRVRVPPISYSSLPFEDDFNTGTMKTAWSWAQATESTTDTTTIIPSGYFDLKSDANQTNYWVEMGKDCDGSFATNALDLHLDLSEQSQVALTFDVNDVRDESQPLMEGLYFSDDGGASFEQVYAFEPENWCNNAWSNFAPFDVDALAAANGLSLTDQFIIRFQQYDNADFSASGRESDGMRIDNIKVYEPQPSYVTAPFSESFNNQDLPSAFQWAQPVTTIREDLRVQPSLFDVQPDANRTNYYLFMGNSCDGIFTTSAVDLHLDASLGTQLILSYDITDRGEEFTPDMDAIFFSNDGGETFTKAMDWDFSKIPNGRWVTQDLNITDLANDAGLALTNTFIVRFQRYDDADGDGIYLDNFSFVASNTAPVVANALADSTILTSEAFTFTFPENTFSDVDGNDLSYAATLDDGTALPSWLTFDAATRTFSGTPEASDVGSINIKVTADDGNGGTAEDTFALTVNTAPVLANAISDQEGITGEPFTFTFPDDTFSDADGDDLSYTAMLDDGSTLPSWLTFTGTSRTFGGTPGGGDAGTLTVKVIADDGKGATAEDSFTISINAKPSLANPIDDQNALVDEAFGFTFPANTFADADGDELTYTATLADDSALPAWLAFDGATRSFSGTATSSDVGSITIKVTAVDGKGATAEDRFVLIINTAPVLVNALSDQNATENEPFTFVVPATTFSDADDDDLTYTATLEDGSALPAWLTFDTGSLTFSGTPGSSDLGSIGITITVDDGKGATAADSFEITVTVPMPSLSDFSPKRGWVGDKLTLTGEKLDLVTAISLNGTAADFTLVDANTLEVVVPDGTTTGSIILTYAGGQVESATNFTMDIVTSLRENRERSFSVYPNPGPGIFIVETNYHESQDISYQVYDLSGKTVAKGLVTSAITEIDLRNYPNGTYIIVLLSDQGRSVTRVIKQ
ncbi:putative Ig domain-containing protein [Cyclobacterium xiamenense]|uniref:putative Ig domain-containing protein n=1 Tax=Cyclobacterium xiamenense TaxID=1297121 RepID=UPI0012B6EA3E|nr:putative Ig domain-containing protein [Cyclobacterium xiamenense]